MSDTNLRGTREKQPPAKGLGQPGHHSADGHHTMLTEAMFLRLLCVERKRAERSGRTFLLVLLETEQMSEQFPAAVAPLCEALCSCIRETDFIGWHKAKTAIGMILTEIGTADKSTIRRAMLDSINAGLRGKVAPEHVSLIRISFYFFPDEDQGQDGGRSADSLLYPDLEWKGKTRRVSRLVKRAIDIAGSLAALIVFSPILAVIAVAVKVTSKGPILFRQPRVGQYGMVFRFLKFRSMRTDSDPKVHREFVNEFIRGSANAAQAGVQQAKVYKITDDPRVTRVGKFIRRTSLDELPQFWNVLMGEMSLVGPRPPIPYELESYRPWHKRRILEVKPGLTGLWQIYGRSRTTFDEMVRLDLRYARTWSILLDLKILVQTPRAMMSGAH
jgi:lipopolysaccharide/colanic/teichoic acid biosynthesis glycosyltransferase